jgi:cytochrome c peroxidase
MLSRLLTLSAVVLPGLLVLGLARVEPALDLRTAYSQPPESWPAANWDEGVERHELGLVGEMWHPADNQPSREKEELGRKLFWDPRLSGSGGVACVSCHHPDLGWTDGKTVSQGHLLQTVTRNAPTLMGVGYQKTLMWDGRAPSLEAQALLPIIAVKEMHADIAGVEERLNAIPAYVEEFKAVFGVDRISIHEVTKAIASFQRSIVPGRSKFDAFLKGNQNALTDQELQGLHLFRTSARCINCHNGPMFTDGLFHNVGLTYYGRKFQDLGRYEQTRDPADVGRFRTPTLRNISRSAPYMHNGLFELDGVINIYNAGMPNEQRKEGMENDPLFPTKSHLLKELNLTKDEKAALIAFLNALEEPRTRVRSPELPQ